MDFPGPILAFGNIKPGSAPALTGGPVCLTIEVRTPTTRGEFIDLEIAHDAIPDLIAKLTNPNIQK